jgi:hypothetical protein
MNKIFTLVAAFAVVALVSCGGHKEEAPATDSLAADTAAAVEAAPVDTAAHADTTAHAEEAHH